MKNGLNANSVGLVFGGVLAFWHLVWSLMVAFGVANMYLTWILNLHRINITISVLPFSLPIAITLILVTGVIGYIVGYIFALIWNAVSKK